MSDPMDRFSRPLDIEDIGLGKIYRMRARASKAGRSLHVGFDARFPLMSGFETRYVYWVHFHTAGVTAGNHYHKRKSEIMYPISGDFDFALEEPGTGRNTRVSLAYDDSAALYVPAGIAHRVRAYDGDSFLLILATAPNTEEDEFEHKIEESHS